MPNYIIEIWENLVERTKGPLHLRFYISPAICIIYAVQAAVHDARKHIPPYLLRFLATPKQRKAMVMEVWKDIGRVLLIAVVVDIVYQLVMIIAFEKTDRFYLLESIFVSLGLTLLPYILIRGPLNRIIGKYYIRKKVRKENETEEHLTHIN